MSNGMEVLCHSVRKNDSKIPLRVYPLPPASFYFCSLLDLCSIFRMNPLQKLLPSGTGFLRVIAIDAKNLLRPEQSASMHVPGPTACVTESLGFGKISFASPDGFFRALMFSNIDHSPDKFPDVTRLAQDWGSTVVCVLERSVRENDLVVRFEVGLRQIRPFVVLHFNRPILRMNPAKKESS